MGVLERHEGGHQAPAGWFNSGGLDFDHRSPSGRSQISLRSLVAAVVQRSVGLLGAAAVGADEAGGAARLALACLTCEEPQPLPRPAR